MLQRTVETCCPSNACGNAVPHRTCTEVGSSNFVGAAPSHRGSDSGSRETKQPPCSQFRTQLRHAHETTQARRQAQAVRCKAGRCSYVGRSAPEHVGGFGLQARLGHASTARAERQVRSCPCHHAFMLRNLYDNMSEASRAYAAAVLSSL
jgi:hypothetical protein